jgi:hypothetical protein
MDYSRVFGVKTLLSIDLQNKILYDNLVNDGFMWIRQRHTNLFHKIVRFPTIGRWVDISRTRFPYSVLIDSKEGKKLINKLCYI